MPYKVWQVNEILTAADMNTYVGNQTILSFAGTAARATAIGTAVEGMLSYVGGGTVEVYAGTATGWTTISGGGGAGVTVGTAAPSSPSEGDLWWDSDDGKMFVAYAGTAASPIWVDAAGPSVAIQSTAPTGYEGQLWLDSDDGNMYVNYVPPGGTASSWIGAVSRSGGILQVVSVDTTTTTTTTSTSYVDFVGLSATITPRSTSSKILVAVTFETSNTTPTSNFARIYRGATAIGFERIVGATTASYRFTGAMQEYDSPSTTASTTYSVDVKVASGTGSFLNGTITLMEVAG